MVQIHPHDFQKTLNSIKEICRNYFLKEKVCFLIKEVPILKFIDDLIEFCTLLTKPENHIKVPSGQYVEKPVYIRPVHDMTDEMAQELIKLPRFTAYAKVIYERNGAQSVLKRKINTLLTPPAQQYTQHIFRSPITSLDDLVLIPLPDIKDEVIESGHQLCKKRSQIEMEIYHRQERWRGSGTEEPPPTHS